MRKIMQSVEAWVLGTVAVYFTGASIILVVTTVVIWLRNEGQP